jgi:hypothetical protein
MAKKDEVTENEDTGEVEGSGNDSRLAMLDAINDQNDADRADEMVEFDESGQVTKFTTPKEEGELPRGTRKMKRLLSANFRRWQMRRIAMRPLRLKMC